MSCVGLSCVKLSRVVLSCDVLCCAFRVCVRVCVGCMYFMCMLQGYVYIARLKKPVGCGHASWPP